MPSLRQPSDVRHVTPPGFSFGSARPEAAGASASSSALAPGRPWHTTENLSAPSDVQVSQGDVTRCLRRRNRLLLRSVIRQVTQVSRLAGCGRGVTGNQVAVKLSPDRAAYVAGVMRCGLIHLCPPCSAKIRDERAKVIAKAAGRWQQAGNTVYMVTFTAPHDLGMPLEGLLKLISGAFSKVIAGRPWKRVKEQAGIVGTIRSLEVTHGPNGWHPHLHVLVLVEGDPGAEGLAAMSLHFRGKWRKVITAAGYRAPSDLHGVKIERCESAAEAGLYISKTQDGRSVGNELARGDMKRGRDGHRTPFQIIDDYAEHGYAADLALWHEYENAMPGHQAITWSKGLKQLLAVTERTDEEIVEAEEDGEVLVLIDAPDWRIIMKNPGLEADILDAAESGGAWAVIGLLADYGIQPSMEDTGRGS